MRRMLHGRARHQLECSAVCDFEARRIRGISVSMRRSSLIRSCLVGMLARALSAALVDCLEQEWLAVASALPELITEATGQLWT